MKSTFSSPLRLSALALATLPVASAAQRYNIVYIMTDDHTAQMMSCYDTRYVQTPNLDRIARDGVRFTHSYVANSLSGPSRACMLTGKHSHANGFTNNEHGIFDGTQQTMPKLMRQAGYQTAMIGKWHLVSLPTGFDYWNILPEQGDYYNPNFITMQNDTVAERGYLTNIITDKAINWMETGRDRSKPFILFIHHKACHRNWLPELKYLREYEDVSFPLPYTFYDNYEGREAAAAQEMHIDRDMDIVYDIKMFRPDLHTRLTPNYRRMISRLGGREQMEYNWFYDSLSLDFYRRFPQMTDGRTTDGTPAVAEFKYQRYMRDYAKVVKSLDDNVGRVLDYLKQSGLDDSTLVVYTSDQGFYMGEHGWFDKRFMYEESFATPLVMKLPKGMNLRGDINELVQNIDYAPTFLDIAGAPVPADMHGVSLLPLLRGEHPRDWRNALYYHYYEYPAEHSVKRHYGVFDGRWKLIHFYRDIDCWELYDLQTDPHELHNLYGQKGMDSQTKRLRRELKRLQQQYNDPILQQFPL